MMKYPISLLLSLFVTIGCSGNQNTQLSQSEWQDICGRDNGVQLGRTPIYRANVPSKWIRHTSLNESIADTKKAICEFSIEDQGRQIRITIHSFPSQTIDERIPPAAQIARWKRQLDPLDLASVNVVPQSHGGFAGFLFEGSGILNNEQTTILGWSMQLAPEHYRHLIPGNNTDEANLLRQMRSDYTIKAVGPYDLVAKYKRSIMAFADSFELIQEIPTSS